MYNVLEKLRSGAKLSAKEQKIHEQGLVSVLKQIHDDLDAAVLRRLRLAARSHGRADPRTTRRAQRGARGRRAARTRALAAAGVPEPERRKAGVAGTADRRRGVGAAPIAASTKAAWPKKLPAQIAAVRDLMLNSDASWTIEQAASLFKGARRADVEAVLESLAALGVVLSYGDGTNRKWRRVGRVAA